jgi:hypothetical protein
MEAERRLSAGTQQEAGFGGTMQDSSILSTSYTVFDAFTRFSNLLALLAS